MKIHIEKTPQFKIPSSKNYPHFIKRAGCGIVCAFLLTGCAGQNGTAAEQAIVERAQDGNQEIPGDAESTAEPENTGRTIEEMETESEIIGKAETLTENFPAETASDSEAAEPEEAERQAAEPETIEVDWSEYFHGLQGAAVLYDASAGQFMVYNAELANTRRSPCSTFKIVSSLAALESGVIEPENSTRKWSGERFWNEEWNQDLDFSDAFHASCVWYFREVIDEIGQERMQEELERLAYGNCDLSDWEGRLNTNNNNRALTGFWIESSLLISPREQTEVMERIFGENSIYSEKMQEALREVMLVEEQKEKGLSIYGKTGMGKAEGVVVDAWFTGFTETEEKTVYFCVYLGRSDDQNVTSAEAKEIAVRLAADHYETASCP